MYKRAIVAVDVYDEVGTKQTLKKAAAINIAFGTNLQLICVRASLPGRYMMIVPKDFQVIEESKVVQKLIEAAEQAKIDVEQSALLSPTGSVTDEVLAASERLGADLIILGAQQSDFSRLFIGSNSNSIMRHSSIDVLLVRFSKD
ncbi:universal stress protein [Sphingomicrobium sp. XHP0235]|uniref:universal stress protein n=1 Tax=Sphingomicrobium aquimarinum TaxID=3133971 RepID=UPI0031FE6F88